MEDKNLINIKSEEDSFYNLLNYFDNDLKAILKRIKKSLMLNIEEIRLRINRPLIINFLGKHYFVDNKGNLMNSYINSIIVTEKMLFNTFKLVCNYSIYAVEEELKNGFITVRGGHRVGIAGKGVYQDSKLETIKEISSLNFRISREKIGVSNKIIPYIIKNDKSIYNTLIISPPQCGKTTLLRDIIRSISNGIPKYKFKGLKIGVVDERSEIAGIYKGIPQNDLGIRTDVFDGIKKYEGIFLLIRSMSPQVIATDELGSAKDINAIHEALKAGVKLISTVHGESIKDIINKPNLREIINEKIFERYIILDNLKGPGNINDIIEGSNFKSIYKDRED